MKETIKHVKINNLTVEFNKTAFLNTITNEANKNDAKPETNGKLDTRVKYLLLGSKFLCFKTNPKTLNTKNKPPQT